jgi:hypothetical protein
MTFCTTIHVWSRRTIGVSRPDVRLPAASHAVGTAIEPEAVHLLVAAVAGIAGVAEDRLDIPAEDEHASRNMRFHRECPD